MRAMWPALLLTGCIGPSDLPAPNPAPSLAPPEWADGTVADEPVQQTHVDGTIQRIDPGVRGFEMTDAAGAGWTATVSTDGQVLRNGESLTFEDLVTGMQVRAEGRIGNSQVLASTVTILGVPSEPPADPEGDPETTEAPAPTEQEAP